MNASEVLARIQSLASKKVAQSSARFFKTGIGEYAEGDIFVGVTVPVLRKLACEYRNLPFEEIKILIGSPIHEARFLALVLLVQSLKKCTQAHRKAVFDFYIEQIHHVNNWDLVDLSAPAIVGGYLKGRSRKPLLTLAKSNSLWERRIAILATWQFIRHNDFDETVTLCRFLLNDPEDLIHKATGWMLREVGKRDLKRLLEFLDRHIQEMPRTTLRYAIERFPTDLKNRYLKKKRQVSD